MVNSQDNPKKKPKLGTTFVIGQPVNETYLHLNSSIAQNEDGSSSKLSARKLIGKTVVIMGILNRANSEQIHILGRQDQKDFYRGLDKIFANVDKALIAEELLAP